MLGGPPKLLSSGVLGGFSLSPEASAIINAMTPTPDLNRQILINNLVNGLSGVWSKLGVLYVFAAHAAQPSLLNWKNPSGTPALAINPIFTVDRGYVGNNASAYIDTQVSTPSIPGFTQNNAHVGGYLFCTGDNVSTITSVSASNPVMGRSSGQLFTRLNTNTADTADAVPANAGTHVVMTRSVAASYDRYVDGVQGTTVVRSSIAVPVSNFGALRLNTTLFGNGANSVRAIHAGAALTASDVASIRSALQAYMAAIGAS